MNNITDQQEVNMHQQFIQQNWNEFAKCAYLGYLTGGRGVMRCDMRRHALVHDLGEIVDVEIPEGIPVGFIPETHFQNEPDFITRKLLDEYDPAREMIFVITSLLGPGTKVYRLFSTPTPMECAGLTVN